MAWNIIYSGSHIEFQDGGQFELSTILTLCAFTRENAMRHIVLGVHVIQWSILCKIANVTR